MRSSVSSAIVRAVLPCFSPLELGRAREPFDHSEWIYELKYDGFRALLYLDQGEARLVSRKGITYTRFGDLTAELAETIRIRNAVLDGEIVCLDAKGRPQFDQLFYRRGTPAFVVFDLLWLNGRDYRPEPLLFRKCTLATIISSGSPCLLNAQYVLERGVDLYRLTCERDLEGIVAKHGQAPYAPIAHRSPWLKIKNPKYTQMPSRWEHFERRLKSSPASARAAAQR